MNYAQSLIAALYRSWMMFARALNYVTSTVVFSLFFGLILGPYALSMMLVRACKKGRQINNAVWVTKSQDVPTIERMRNLF